MVDEQSHKRFLGLLAAIFLFVFLLGSGFNYLVDPYGLFGTRRIDGFNERKPAASERVRVTKPYMAARAQARTVIGGNSRPEMGIDPQSACWTTDEQPVFNSGIPGADIAMQTRYVQHAAERGQAQRIFFGVDFFDFLVDVSTMPTGNIDWERLEKNYAGRLDQRTGFGFPLSLQQLDDRFSGLVSLVALGDSIKTVTAQRDVDSATRREDGFNPGLDYRPIIRNEGQAVLFSQKNREVRERLQRRNLGIHGADGQQALPLQALRRFLQWSKDHNIEVVLFINPYHADYLTQIELTGNWALFETWRQQVAVIAAEHAVPLWDFNAFDRYSTESPPAPGDKRHQLQWFWEPAHYRQELGDLMLASMLGRPCGGRTESGAYGVRLIATTLQDRQAALRKGLLRYVDDNSQVVERLGGRVRQP